MKIKLLLIPLLTVVLISCDNFNSKKAYDDYSRLASGEQSINIESVELQKPERSNAFYERMLEEFCQRYYNDCFDGRSYIRNSLVVLERKGEETTHIYGKHSYEGRYGRRYSNAEFMATIEEEDNGYFKVTFTKESAPDMFHNETYQESGTRTMHYSE